jgi:hypothetical protein
MKANCADSHPSSTGNQPTSFSAARERTWLQSLIASPLWSELNAAQRQHWLHQLQRLNRFESKT